MTPTSKQSFDLEQEKMLPGVVMAVEGQVFDMLYQLADLDESRCVRNEELQSNIAQMNEWSFFYTPALKEKGAYSFSFVCLSVRRFFCLSVCQ